MDDGKRSGDVGAGGLVAVDGDDHDDHGDRPWDRDWDTSDD